MTEQHNFDVIIIGGSYAGLSAAMSLGRAIRQVLVIDSGKPCNIQTPHSHNYLTQDGATPAAIAQIATQQVLSYPTVSIRSDKAISVTGENNHFEVSTESGNTFWAKKLLFTTGIRDLIPAIPGFSESWGISVIHCPYCHGYEYRDQKTGILINGEHAFEFGRLINNWTKDLTIYTNGAAAFDQSIRTKIEQTGIKIVETTIEKINHTNGHIQSITFSDHTSTSIQALYARVPFEQHCAIPINMGVEFTDMGYIQTDDLQRTNIAGIYAAGDNSTMMRSVSAASAAGSKAGAMMNHHLISEGL